MMRVQMRVCAQNDDMYDSGIRTRTAQIVSRSSPDNVGRSRPILLRISKEIGAPITPGGFKPASFEL